MNWRQILAIVSSIAIIISAFLVWVRISTPLGDLTVTGIEGNEGYIAIAIGLAGLTLTLIKSSYTLLAGLLGLVLAIVELVDMFRGMDSGKMLESSGIFASLGAGLYTLLLGSLVLMVSGILIQQSK